MKKNSTKRKKEIKEMKKESQHKNSKATIDPEEYFNRIKNNKNKITDEELLRIKENALILFEKYKKTNQTKAMKKLAFHIENLEKERKIIKLGVNQFVYREAIEDYIENVASQVVKIIELENYERDIPDEIVEIVEKTRGLFTNFYVLFTDYTGKVEKEVVKEKRRKDPILFGAFVNHSTDTVIERFYYLGDWEDQYCDLTLDKFINEMEIAGREEIIKTISIPENLDELKTQIDSLSFNSDGMIVMNNQKPPRKSFFKRIRTIFSKKKRRGQ